MSKLLRKLGGNDNFDRFLKNLNIAKSRNGKQGKHFYENAEYFLGEWSNEEGTSAMQFALEELTKDIYNRIRR